MRLNADRLAPVRVFQQKANVFRIKNKALTFVGASVFVTGLNVTVKVNLDFIVIEYNFFYQAVDKKLRPSFERLCIKFPHRAPPKGFPAVSHTSLMEFREDVSDIYAEGVLPEDEPDDFRLIFIDGNFFAVFFITVEKMSAGVIAFALGFVHVPANFLRKLCGVIFGIPFEHTLENDALGRIGDMFGIAEITLMPCSLRVRL